MNLKLTRKEEADVIRRRAARGRRKIAGPKIQHDRAKPKGGRDLEPAYLSWLHHGVDCIACLVLTRAPARYAHIEAAHQKLNVAAAGWSKKLGVRSDDDRCVPLCEWHHRTGPLRCDPAQAKFWGLVGLELEEVADFCAELHLAFRHDKPALPIIHHYAGLVLGRRAS